MAHVTAGTFVPMTTVTTLATCLVRNMFSVGDISADVTRVVDFLKGIHVHLGTCQQKYARSPWLCFSEGEVKSGDCFEHLASLLISIVRSCRCTQCILTPNC